jgi:Domain of unknown function (DUF5666)
VQQQHVQQQGVQHMKTTLVAAGTLAALVACGGGGSSGSMSQTGAQSVATWGTITAFGSVYVNGVRYDVSRATLKKNDTTVAQTGLAVGEVALVRGREDTQTGQGEADSVDVEDSVVGPITTITGNQLTVLGQTISVTANTSFGPGIADLTALKGGDSIEVSGLPGMDGVIMATRIGRAESNEPLQVLGTVGTVSATTLMINGLTVDFSTANVSGFASGKPATGDLVIARGTVFDSTAVKLTATAVRLAETDRGDQAEGGLVEEEGLITRFVSATDFDVAGAKVTTTASTVFKNGTAADLALNVRVEVRGTLDANKVLMADVVEIEHIAVIALAATVSGVDTTMSTLTVLGVTISVDTNTRFEDQSSAQVEMFTLKDVAVGDTVLVRGYEHPAGSGMVLATRLVRLPPLPSMDVAVRGPFTASTATQFKILGITIDATSAKLYGKGGQSLTIADFFTQAVGQVVDVLGTASGSGSTVTASKAIIDPLEDR